MHFQTKIEILAYFYLLSVILDIADIRHLLIILQTSDMLDNIIILTSVLF